MLKMLIFAAVGAIAAGTVSAQQQPYLNLDFETMARGQLWGWTSVGDGYDFGVDTNVAYTGAQSGRIRNISSSARLGYYYQSLPANRWFGKDLTITGYIKTDSITNGSAKLSLLVEDTAGKALCSSNSAGIKGTTDWTSYSVDCPVTPDAYTILFGVQTTGPGTVWMDDFSIALDGAAFIPGPAPVIGEPSTDQLAWLAQAANPFWTFQAGNGFDDLWPLAGMVGNAHIVGLGEGTHGTDEFFRMKHRVLEYLVNKMGFTVFAIEANMPEAYAMNDYVLNGRGDPKQFLLGMYFWDWNTQEVLDMVEWMRQYNAAGNGPPVQFTGFDMQTPDLAAAIVLKFLQSADPAYYGGALPVYSQCIQLADFVSTDQAAISQAIAGAHAIWQHIDQNRAQYANSFSAQDIEWAAQNARIVEQAVTYLTGGSFYRDRAMAANFEWILQQNPGAKAVIWAHDLHVWTEYGAMGSYLRANHGADYLAVGQLLHSGSYNALPTVLAYDPAPNVAVPSFPGSVEYVLHASGMPQFFLDLRQAAAAGPAAAWLTGETQFRTVGAVAQDGFQVTDHLPGVFDILIFFDQTNPTMLLPWF